MITSLKQYIYLATESYVVVLFFFKNISFGFKNIQLCKGKN